MPHTVSGLRAGSLAEGPPVSNRVLVVGDEVDVADAACALLDMLGFTSHQVGHASGALELLEAGATFSVVMTDNHMPGMTGHELAVEIRRRWPPLPVFIVTGRPELFIVPHLQKPYSERQLLDMIDSVRNERAASVQMLQPTEI